jgi:hypothetical protein
MTDEGGRDFSMQSLILENLGGKLRTVLSTSEQLNRYTTGAFITYFLRHYRGGASKSPFLRRPRCDENYLHSPIRLHDVVVVTQRFSTRNYLLSSLFYNSTFI